MGLEKAVIESRLEGDVRRLEGIPDAHPLSTPDVSIFIHPTHIVYQSIHIILYFFVFF